MIGRPGSDSPSGGPSSWQQPSDGKPEQQLPGDLTQPLSHPDFETLQGWADQVVHWIFHHFQTLPDQRIGLSGTRSELENLLREDPPEQGSPFADVLAQFQSKVVPFAFRTNHPRFLAFIPGAPNFVSVLGDWLCAGTNFFGGVWLEAAGPTEVELVVLDWFKQWIGYPAEAQGILTSGGSEATLTALLVARERLGFEERNRAVLYVTEQRHWSVDRAAKVIGLRPDQVRPLRAGKDFRMEPLALEEAIREDRRAGRLPWALCANAGATRTGTVDPLAELAALCGREQIWFHVDAAYSWPAVLIPEGRQKLDGITQADSITLDPHKWFGQTFESGCVLVRQGQGLAKTFTLRPDYMQDVAPEHDEVNFADRGLALTRKFRALKIWLSVKVLGLCWSRNLVERCCRLAAFAEDLLAASPVFEILSPRQLSIVCFRYRSGQARDRAGLEKADLDALNLALINELRATGRAFLSSTRLHGQVALRLCFVNWRTTAADVEEVIRLLMDIGTQLARESKFPLS